MRVDAHRHRRWVAPCLTRRVAVQIDHRRKTRWLSANDRERHRQAELRGANDRLRRPTDGDPHRDWILDRTRIHAEAADRCASGSGASPRHALVVAKFEKKVELLRE